jgi:pimeloyl-ACP methyl ester carboxylesterase
MYFRQFDGRSIRAEAVIILHGFPSYSSKNDDIAATIAEKSGLTVYTPHFRGLGLSPGLFSFSNSMVDATEFCNQLETTRQVKIHLIGHSYGGAVSLLISNRIPSLASVTLVNPLLRIPNQTEVKSIVQQFVIDERARGNNYETNELILDLEASTRDYDPTLTTRILSKNAVSISAITSTADANLDQVALENWLEESKGLIQSSRISGDHWFSESRDLLASEIANFLSKRF